MRLTRAARENVFVASLLFPGLFFIVAFVFYPIIYSIYLSLHRIVLGLPSLGRPFIGLDNYLRLLEDRVALHSMINTLVFVFTTTFFEILCGLLIALVINRQFKGRGIARAAILVPWAIPTVVSSQMWRFIFNDNYGMLNYIFFGYSTHSYAAWLAHPSTAFAAIVIADVWKTSSFAGLLILAGLQLIPDELYRAARIDGASPWQQFRRITLPLIKPALLIALLFRTIDAFRVFDLVFVMTQGGPADSTNVLQFYGYKKIFTEGLMGYGSTISVLVFVISLVVSLVYIKTVGTRLFQNG
ncbi:MAG: sugar ABC transporter permease [Nitrospiraceae bacterium]|nr:MAG: sugar ABC transporter permease [Nitrospiraceae bacterium]